mmetsp:Transcript_7976/g.9216  ORF Transcript_7976/g.9216 Transcript_7976/m.9216 type:complete len:100 (+) Transcript_7976:65-364(+)
MGKFLRLNNIAGDLASDSSLPLLQKMQYSVVQIYACGGSSRRAFFTIAFVAITESVSSSSSSSSSSRFTTKKTDSNRIDSKLCDHFVAIRWPRLYLHST